VIANDWTSYPAALRFSDPPCKCAARLAGLEQRLVALNPEAILQRGYALVRQPDGRLVRSIHQAIPGEALQVRVSDGNFAVRVMSPSKE
jgi:exodeoxyribonuclease VII large subunit